MEVAEVLPEFADAFAFEEFNRMQREALPGLLESDENVVASAPTASGKTALAELAICKALSDGGTALFIAPLRALTNEKEDDWERFENLDYSVYVVTGERDLNPRRARRADILVMTPEKLDSATRKHDSRRYDFVTDIDVCVIDEVHLLDADRRGSVLEVTISRLRRLCAPRVVALSATMPNVDDVAAWLDAPEETTFEFGDKYRPVDLHAGVKTYTHGENSFADKYRRLYRALDIAEPHLREDGQALVFVSSRQDTVRAAEKARDEIAKRDVPMTARHDFHDYDFHDEKEDLENETLSKSVTDGVAFHHAGLSKNDRDFVEKWFKKGAIELLFSTSTLAWGVNLPARCVVIRDTKHHDPLEGEVDMSPLDVLQMLGRAGRPGYDDVGYGWVVCDGADADKYRQLLRDGKEIESRLAETLETHLNAEIAMGTIADLEDVMDWLETTFYYVRGQSKPDAYDFPNLRQRVRDCLEGLVDRGFVETGPELSIEATPRGVLASKYYLRLETAATFAELCDRVEEGESLEPEDILEAVATAGEFDSVSARQSERDAINAVLVGQETGDLEAGQRKVLAILRGAASGSTPSELRSDAWVIRRNATRLISALGAFLDRLAGPHAANLARRVEARVENGVAEDAVGLTAIEGVGPGRASKLATEGISTPEAVMDAGLEGLVDAGLSEGVAQRVYEGAQSLPVLEIDWGSFPESIAMGENDVREVTVRNVGEPARAGIRVTVNGVEMSSTSTYLRDTETVPVGVFGADEDDLEFTISVAFPEEPLVPLEESRTVDVV
ncbi:DEAD/DEAH box helicase [Natronorubrum bangense]|uniref:DEAD/DEAH box helicase domain-containing protein n=2 Tax=Natronorubrum bangense TaxID=61858 RepID=L9WKM3_9EURY|nr:DEAD/DEAH box helicase [Natronorubrum bangense]ELY50020.1 DEAD/DEAH box helicase domain-containing protein [Natronorubrum bangense JCM 10635]QCC54132.1 DEAD/DEAH box helicase [Natronorubrum bangense]